MSALGRNPSVPLALALSLVACASVLGVEDLPRADRRAAGGSAGTGAAPATTPVVYRDTSCAACVADACFDDEVACRVDPTCSAAYACLAACPANDPSCRWGCESTHETSLTAGSLADVLDLCRRKACGDTCFGAFGLLGALGAECGACVDAACIAEEAACVAGRDCERAAECALARPVASPDADFDCLFRFDPARTIGPLLSCYAGCKQACAVGKHDACVDQYTWRRLASAPVTQTFSLHPYPNTAVGAPGLTVRACNTNDCVTCALPVDTQMTDDSGAVTLALPLDRGAFEGCLFVDGPGYPPSLLSLGRPISRPQAAIQVNMPTTALLALVSTLTGVTLDPARGHVIAQTWDCLLDGATGITFELDPPDAATTPFFIHGAKLDTGVGQTDAGAAGGFFNVAPGRVTVRGRVAATGAIFSEQVVTVLAGGVTGAQMYPRATE